MAPLDACSGRDLAVLLAEECGHWSQELDWDFSEVSAAVAAGLDRGGLAGRVVQDDFGPVAYCYYVQEPGRTVIGSLFSATRARGSGREEAALAEVLRETQAPGGPDRVECQTLFSTAPGADAAFAAAGFESRPRHYLVLDLKRPRPQASAARRTLRPLRRQDLPLAAEIVQESHRGSLDAALNLTYATPRSCRHFVETLVLRSGCGRFDAEASFIAEVAGRPEGVLLASRLSPSNGHICQVSVRPSAQGHGVGLALMLAALEALARGGLARASLSVTVGNERAARLYAGLGFELRRGFAAHAWLRPPQRLGLP
ncbi:MAG: GNAT family N-acetyltransferase [Vicinamibacteria bacterium]